MLGIDNSTCYKFKNILIFIALIIFSLVFIGLDAENFSQPKLAGLGSPSGNMPAADTLSQKPKITFLELGSTSCVPCKQMEEVLETTSEKYGDQIEIIFIDMMKDRQEAKKYNVRVMPTQVFLDTKGKEIYRHIGFYPQKQLDEFLQKQGLIPSLLSDE